MDKIKFKKPQKAKTVADCIPRMLQWTSPTADEISRFNDDGHVRGHLNRWISKY